MGPSRTEAVRGVLRSWVARIWVFGGAAAAFYQFGCDQFDWPKLPALWGMTGVLVPWWGWLIIAQLGFTYGLFEYVRRGVPESVTEGRVEELINSQITAFAGALTDAFRGKAGSSAEAPKPALTTVEKERCAETIHETHDLLVGRLDTLTKEIVDRGNHSDRSDYEPLVRKWCDESEEVRKALASIRERRALSIEQMGLDLSKLTHAIMALSLSTRETRRAFGWNREAFQEKAGGMVRDNSQLILVARAAKETIKEKRREYLDR